VLPTPPRMSPEGLKTRQQQLEAEASSAKTHPHWALFETVDEDLRAFSRHVEFDPANFPTYSVTLLRLYLSICSEVDVVAKLLCQRINAPLPSRPNIDHYRKALKPEYTNLSTVKITVRPMAYEILPWQAWEQDKNPDWWQKHQSVKHHRDQRGKLVSFCCSKTTSSGFLSSRQPRNVVCRSCSSAVISAKATSQTSFGSIH
jgi:hypothetical protein